MIQDGFDWHRWRLSGIGSSDAPVVMGVSPYATIYKLWETKTGRRVDEENNWATERGKRLESRARATYEFEHDVEMTPKCLENPALPWLRASVDGINSDGSVVLEIKCPGAEDHHLAVQGKVPPKYYPQLQHQLLVTGADRVDYYSYDGETGVVVRVLPDFAYQSRLLFHETNFWNLNVKGDIPPALVDRDYKLIRGDPELKRRLESGLYVKEISETFRGQRVRCAGYYIDDELGVRKGL